jgi:hypothetical protein
MSNRLYDVSRQGYLTGTLDWDSDSMKAALLSISYSPNYSTDQHFSDVSTFQVGSSVALTSVTSGAGVAEAANVTFTAVTGLQVGSVVVYKDTGTPSTSPLIFLVNTGTGLPVTPDGTDIVVSWFSGQIFVL